MATPTPTDTSFTILYFAAASTYTGKNSERLPAPLPLRSLFEELESRYPGVTAKVLSSCAVTVNLDYVDLDAKRDSNIKSEPSGVPADSSDGDDGAMINNGDEVGIIPPVSSG